MLQKCPGGGGRVGGRGEGGCTGASGTWVSRFLGTSLASCKPHLTSVIAVAHIPCPDIDNLNLDHLDMNGLEARLRFLIEIATVVNGQGLASLPRVRSLRSIIRASACAPDIGTKAAGSWDWPAGFAPATTPSRSGSAHHRFLTPLVKRRLSPWRQQHFARPALSRPPHAEA